MQELKMSKRTVDKSIHVIHFKGASGKFSFHFKEVCEKCIEYIGKFFIQIKEISKILIKNVLEQIVWVISRSSLKVREVSHVC